MPSTTRHISSTTEGYLRGILALSTSQNHRISVQTNNPRDAIRTLVAHSTSETTLKAALRVFSHVTFEFDSLDGLKRILMSLVKRTSSAEALAAALDVLLKLSPEGMSSRHHQACLSLPLADGLVVPEEQYAPPQPTKEPATLKRRPSFEYVRTTKRIKSVECRLIDEAIRRFHGSSAPPVECKLSDDAIRKFFANRGICVSKGPVKPR